jgi:hypothetical protein
LENINPVLNVSASNEKLIGKVPSQSDELKQRPEYNRQLQDEKKQQE